MVDPRIERYATLLVDTCTHVEPGWQVLVWGMPAARPLLEEIMRQLGRRGAPIQERAAARTLGGLA